MGHYIYGLLFMWAIPASTLWESFWNTLETKTLGRHYLTHLLHTVHVRSPPSSVCSSQIELGVQESFFYQNYIHNITQYY